LVDLSCGGIRHESSFSLYVDFGMERSKHGVSAFLLGLSRMFCFWAVWSALVFLVFLVQGQLISGGSFD
jgi:polyferredoxin